MRFSFLLRAGFAAALIGLGTAADNPADTASAPIGPPPPAGLVRSAAPQARSEESADPTTLARLEAALHAIKSNRGLRLVLPADVLFAGKQRDLVEAAATPLETLAKLIAATKPPEIVVTGHTDSAGDDDANLALSKDQAQAVIAWLSEHVPQHPPHFIADGYGRSRPVAPNHNADGSDNPEGRASNRRIEILLRRR